ncbi:hypothetical protein LAZ67_2003231 [Cordylochernes scorpioides]|uniref:DUF5641 domain-containing protein n=1 Tax=Cordylochernes scorpioides TaxID=51811 RepID=A0ABY6K3S4_9ARAC|nr:hypothetical protein LAZ67_2003231 [Cordylochernes scorpioides]
MFRLYRSLHNYSAPQGESSSQETSKLSSSQQANPTSSSLEHSVELRTSRCKTQLLLILHFELALGPPDAPIGWRTPLGRTVGGNFDDLMETQGCVNYTVSEPVNDNDLHELIKSSFSTENFGIIPRTRWQGMNQVEGRAYDILQKTIKRTEALAPLKKLTIPKLELQGCVLGTRFAALLLSELRLTKVDREVFWSDSKTALAWIRSEAGRYKEFVANRVGEIQEAKKETDWSWVPISENPADIAPRFETFENIERCVMVVWKAAKLWRVRTQRKRPRLHRPSTRFLNLEDFSSLNRLVCRAAAVQKAARFWYKKTFHKSGQQKRHLLAAYQRPFTFTGQDAFGPFTVTFGRRHEKRWVISFTCLVTRAIHLEVVHALSTDEFMMGLSQFIDTRGRPDTIFSDNGTNFVGTTLKSAENIINSRPLTYVSSDPTKEYSLTPNLFLRGANNADELHPRNMWKRGFVSDVHFGPDVQVRVATITTMQNGKAVIYKRPVTKIFPFGLRMELGERRGRFMKTSSINRRPECK